MSSTSGSTNWRASTAYGLHQSTRRRAAPGGPAARGATLALEEPHATHGSAFAARAATWRRVLVAGTPGSPGVAEGPVRIVLDPAAFGSLRPGEVLVAPYTNPSWTPLFRRAAAVVVDTGAAMSHAAIVAREYGVPAVMGTGDGTRRLSDGQWVRVDGSRGQVSRPQRQAKTLRRE